MPTEHPEKRAKLDKPHPATEAREPAGEEAPAKEQASREAPAPVRAFEDLSISELLALLWHSPKSTVRRLRLAINSEPMRQQLVPALQPADGQVVSGSEHASVMRATWRTAALRILQTEYPRLAIYLSAFALALAGSSIARGTADISRSEGYSLQVAAPYLWLGFLLWLFGDIYGHWPSLIGYWRRCDRATRVLWVLRLIPAIVVLGGLFRLAQSMAAPREAAVDIALASLALLVAGTLALPIVNLGFKRFRIGQVANPGAHSLGIEQVWIVDRKSLLPPIWSGISRKRKLLVLFASALSLVVWTNSGGNRLEPPFILTWLASIVAWGFVFAPLGWNLFDRGSCAIDKFRRLSLGSHLLVIIALALVMLLGAGFHFGSLDSAPPEMNSDMVVNILDAYKIHRGEDHRVFLANNGGREPLHIYLMAFAASLPGLGFDRATLYLVSAVEGFLTLPVMFWFAVAVIGKQRRGHALLVGLLATALLAGSFWQVSLARQGLRIPLSPLLTALSGVYFARALRHNRRSDFILAGITLSFGLYSYKSMRMLPLVYVAGVAMALLLRRYSWQIRAKYLLNLTVLAFMAGAVFVPMLRFWVEEPAQFTQRATSRMFGDQPTTDAERIDLLRHGAATFLSNTRSALLMFHYTNDNTWISALPNQPAMDPVTAALLLLGAAAWLGLLASARDPVHWFVPILFLVMVLLTALAIAFPIEVPSMQRASGAIPAAYVIAALPLALLCQQFVRTLPRILGIIAAFGFAVLLIISAHQYNRGLYFGEFMDNYHRSAQNHAEAGQVLRGFAESGGAYGNAFIISSPHWWDHRAVGVEAGAVRWDNSIVGVDRLPQYLSEAMQRTDEYRLQPDKDLLFFFAPRNREAPPLLSEWFPAGRQLEIRQEPAEKTFFIYRVPALGATGLLRFLAESD